MDNKSFKVSIPQLNYHWGWKSEISYEVLLVVKRLKILALENNVMEGSWIEFIE